MKDEDDSAQLDHLLRHAGAHRRRAAVDGADGELGCPQVEPEADRGEQVCGRPCVRTAREERRARWKRVGALRERV